MKTDNFYYGSDRAGGIEDQLANDGRELGRKIKSSFPTYIVVAEVLEVDEENFTLNAVVDQDRVFSDITLDVFPNGGNSVYLIPEVGSLVLLGFIEGFTEEPILLKTTKVSKLLIWNQQTQESTVSITEEAIDVIRGTSSWRIEDKKVSLTAELIEMDGGDLDGLVIVGKLTERLNKLETEINNIQSAITSHSHLVTGTCPSGGGPLAGGATCSTTYSTVTLTQFQNSDYENTKITQ